MFVSALNRRIQLILGVFVSEPSFKTASKGNRHVKDPLTCSFGQIVRRPLLLVVAAILVVLGVGGWGVSAGVQWWDEKAIASAQTEKDELQQDVADLTATKEAWVQAGMLDKIQRCGSENRPCVAVDENAGQFGPQGGPYDLRVLQGY